MPEATPSPSPPPPPASWNLLPKDGGAPYTVTSREALNEALRRGDTVESTSQGAGRAQEQGQVERYDDLASAARALIKRGLGAASLGLTDVASRATGNEYDLEQNRLEIKANPTAATVGTVAGTLAPALLSGGAGTAGAIARATPAGRLAAAGANIAARGAEKGALAKVGAGALGGAVEGGIQSAGSYVSDVALGDRDLSAEGAFGAIGKGALLGGGIGSGVALTEKGLIAAKRLFPESGANKAQATQSAQDVSQALDRALSDARSAESALAAQAGDATRARIAVDPVAAERAARVRAAVQSDAALSTPSLNPLDAAPRAKSAPASAEQLAKAQAAADADAALLSPSLNPLPPAAPLRRGSLDGALRELPPARVGATADEIAEAEAAAEARRAATATERPIDVFHSPGAKPSGPGGLTKSVDDDLEDRLQAALDAYAARGAGGAKKTRAPRGSKGKTAEVLEESSPLPLPPSKRARGRKKAAAAAAPADDLEAQLLASLDATAPAAAKRGVPAGAAADDLEAQLAASLSAIRRGDAVAAPAARSIDDAVEDAVADSISVESRAAARELQIARRELEEAVSALPARKPVPQVDAPLLSSPLVARAAGADALDPGGDAVSAMKAALRGGAPDVIDDVARVVPAIQRFEAAEARAAQVLGDLTPAGLKSRVAQQADTAAAHRAKTQLADEQSADYIGRAAAGDLAEAMARSGRPAADAAANVAYPSKAGLGVLDDGAAAAAGSRGGGALDAASALEVLGGLGIPGLPSAKSIPIVGPLLSAYLQARTAARVFGKFRGKMPATVEARAARSASQTRDRMFNAVRGFLDTTAKGSRRAAIPAISAAEMLSRPFFGGKSKETDEQAAFKKTVAELDRLSDPAVLRDAVREALPTSDPELARAAEAVAARKADYLLSKVPRPPMDLSSPFERLVENWRPSKPELMAFARIKQAVDDPAGVLESALAGDLSIDGVEAFKTVYPRQYQQARLDLFQLAVERGGELPRQRRIQLSTLFDVPMDASLTPTFLAQMQALYAPPPPEPPQQPLQAQAPSPGISQSVRFSERAALPGEQQR